MYIVHLKLSIHEDICSFFASANSILNSMIKPTQNVLIRLLYSNCVPRLTYGAAVKQLDASEKQQMNVAINNAVRRIFGFRQRQSIRQLREFYGFKPIDGNRGRVGSKHSAMASPSKDGNRTQNSTC